MIATIDHAGLSDLGRARRENQDRWMADPSRGLYLVADGMGGAHAGSLASRIVVDTLPALLGKRLDETADLSTPEAEQVLYASLVDLSSRLRRESRGQPGFDGMGSTVVLAIVRQLTALVAHLGDSRAYLFRDGILQRLTTDHTILQLFLDSGQITPEEALAHPARCSLTRFVGMEGEALPEVRRVSLRPDDCLLLCSDGLTGMLTEEQIASVLQHPSSLTATCGRLVDLTNEAGGRDNVTVLLISVDAAKQPLEP